MTIEELKSVDAGQMASICELIKQLNPECTTSEDNIRRIIAAHDSHLYVLLDGQRIVGCVSFGVFYAPTIAMASIEDVVVLEEYRGRHLGRQLMEYVLKEAERYSPIQIHLTSRPSRVAANNLYRSLGFKRKDTNFYVLNV